MSNCKNVNQFNVFAASLPIQIVQWINSWLEVNVAIRKCQFTEAIAILEALQSTSPFGNNELITVMLGHCYYYNGDHDIALTHLHRAHANNFYILDGLSNFLFYVFCQNIVRIGTSFKCFILNCVFHVHKVYWEQFMQKKEIQRNWKN